MNYIHLGLDALIILSVFGSRRKSRADAKAIRQHVTKSLHHDRIIRSQMKGGDNV